MCFTFLQTDIFLTVNSMNIIFEDEELVVAEKPVGVLSEGEKEDCMPFRLKEVCGGELSTVHRLDRGVGGIMVYARTQFAARELSKQIAQRSLEKVYLALLHGQPEESSGRLEDLLFKDSSKNKTYVVKRERKGVKKAALAYETLCAGSYHEAVFTLVRIRLETGRSHQIRVQFASRKNPLFGDGKYGSTDNEKNIALWSYSLSFFHPKTKEHLTFTLTPPEDSLFGKTGCLQAI